MNNEDPDIVMPDSTAGEVGSVLARVSEVLPDQLLILPLKIRPFFPAQTMPIVLEEELWGETLERVGKTPHQLVGLVYARHDDSGLPQPEDFAVFGHV